MATCMVMRMVIRGTHPNVFHPKTFDLSGTKRTNW